MYSLGELTPSVTQEDPSEPNVSGDEIGEVLNLPASIRSSHQLYMLLVYRYR
jgi:hypothetical protein